MNDETRKAFNKANEVMHPIETQWHYPIMIEHGYKSETPPQKGFVRSYQYEHPETGRVIDVTTGSSADYWNDRTSGEFGYWSDLEPHLKSKK